MHPESPISPSYSFSKTPKKSPVAASSKSIASSHAELSSSDQNTSTSRQPALPLSGGVGASSDGSGVSNGGNSNSLSKNSPYYKPKQTHLSSRVGRDVKVRPGSASTIDSYASAMPFSSDDYLSSAKKMSFSSQRSSSSSTNRTFTDSKMKSLNFDQMLQSGETKVISETANVARSNSERDRSEEQHGVEHLTPRKIPKSERGTNAIVTGVREEREEDETDYEEVKSGLKGRSDIQILTPKVFATTSPFIPPRSPLRPSNAVEGNTSVDARNLQQLANPASGALALPAVIPIHPHHRTDGDPTEQSAHTNSDSRQRSDNLRTTPFELPTNKGAPALSIRDSTSPNQAFASPSLTAGSSSTGRSRSRTSDAAPHSSTSNSSQATFTVLPRQSSINAQETDPTEGKVDYAPEEKGANNMKERFKKTSGFLRRLGGGSSADKTRLNSSIGQKINRKPSQSSITSEGGASVANSMKSLGGEQFPRWGSQGFVPVPNIPTKYKGTSESKRGRQGNPYYQESLEATHMTPSTSSASTEVGSTSSSAQTARYGGVPTSLYSGSNGSTSTEMKHALAAWENEMDATLKQSGQDLDLKTKIEKPSPHWTPTPQLPEYTLNKKNSFMDEDSVEEDATRNTKTEKYSSSVSNLALSTTLPRQAESLKNKARSYDNQYLHPQQPQRSTSLGYGLPPGVATTNTVYSDPIVPTTAFSTSPQLDANTDDPYLFRRVRDDSTSYASTKSFETAIDRPSFFVRHSQRSEASKDESTVGLIKDPLGELHINGESKVSGEEGVPGGKENDLDSKDEESEGGDIDAEKSIRLITSSNSEPEDSVNVARDEEAYKHGKDRTLTSNIVASRSASPARDVMSPAPTEEIISEETEATARDLASKCWTEDESFKGKEKIAEWLGGIGPLNRLARKYYMERFDFAGLRIDAAFRRLCDKLFLRAETQQVDRILTAFSQRFISCNPQSSSVLLDPDVVHALVFAILLLNTDLHVADIQDRMTRNQFVRNTLAAIHESNEATATQQTWNTSNTIATRSEAALSQSSLNVNGDTLHLESSSTVPVSRVGLSRKISNDAASTAGSDVARSPLNKTWEAEMEGILKEIYTAVKSDQIRLPITDASTLEDNAGSRRPHKIGSDRVNALKRGSIRGIQGLLGANSPNLKSDENLTLSRTSFNSTNRSFSDYHANSTTPTTSMASASSYGFQPSGGGGGGGGGLAPTLGFANTLSQSIIKEANNEDDHSSLNSVNDDFTDDELALMGPPWAKEGMLTRKHYWETSMKRAKDKNWTDCFVVVQKGVMSMFRFGDSGSGSGGGGGGMNGGTKSGGKGVGVGGGNWLSNATCVGEFSLAHTLANSLPPPGYNRSRPHVFALTIPGDSVYFFQTGHEELVQEWVSTCNYWAARQSKEPLAGGVSNMEYGWNRVMPGEGLDLDDSLLDSTGHTSRSSLSAGNNYNNSDNRSIRSGKSGKSLRMRATNTSFFQSRHTDRSNTPTTTISSGGLSSPAPSNLRNSSTLHAFERPLFINEWRTPAPPTVSSILNEEDQLEACKRYKARLEAELIQHNALRQPMLDYFESMGSAHSSANTTKALANFDKKASYLLSDLTKFTLYSATLTSSNKLKLEKRDARQLNRMMLKADEESSNVEERGVTSPVMR
ncbi:hypothetical protein CBS101457_006282 [Exobasidium rhododendri]|nr:hypothetical protein CBS101457_006282 [Exobasidium rhododendri]